MCKIAVIPVASGSTGNCIYLEIGPYHLLIDMGAGYRKVRDALSKNGRDIEKIDAVFLTHGHNDHIKGALPISRHTSCRVYTNETIMYPIRDIPSERVVLETEREREVLPGLKVKMFTVPHDYVKTCGYTFTWQEKKIGYVTDCGRMNEKIFEELKGSDVVVLESNHDVKMLKEGPYPYYLKKRILSEYGHLSNDDCADTVRGLYENGTRNFLLAHLSRHNNTPEKAYETIMTRMEGKDISLYICPVEGDDLLEY
ncbi:MAG: MBL fold metallo-hydrolase [Erysipelotrichaceae bacterium]|nr:MBL fold metallo-hydrolase [Erysipelotrichaceae bacterium]